MKRWEYAPKKAYDRIRRKCMPRGLRGLIVTMQTMHEKRIKIIRTQIEEFIESEAKPHTILRCNRCNRRINETSKRASKNANNYLENKNMKITVVC